LFAALCKNNVKTKIGQYIIRDAKKTKIKYFNILPSFPYNTALLIPKNTAMATPDPRPNSILLTSIESLLVLS
jgi:hypothetical protein